MAEGINIESFEVTKGGLSGDLLSKKNDDVKLEIGLMACGYFEYWRMYEGLRDQVVNDMQCIADRLIQKHNVVYSGLIETPDGADEFGRAFNEAHVDMLILTEGTYCPDYFVHQVLNHLPKDIPIVCFAAQSYAKIDFNSGYDQSLRNSGPMGKIQLTGGFRKIGKYEKFEVVSGAIDEEAYHKIDSFIQVFTTINNLKNVNICTIGHVFRGRPIDEIPLEPSELLGPVVIVEAVTR